VKWEKESRRTIAIRSYVTLRSEWSPEMARWAPLQYNARGHRVVDDRMEWRFFTDEIEAKKWCDVIHSSRDTADVLVPSATFKSILDTLERVLMYADSHTCLHEDTHRAGTIWEICTSCGKKWSDDEGGKPADANAMPKILDKAWDLLKVLQELP